MAGEPRCIAPRRWRVLLAAVLVVASSRRGSFLLEVEDHGLAVTSTRDGRDAASNMRVRRHAGGNVRISFRLHEYNESILTRFASVPVYLCGYEPQPRYDQWIEKQPLPDWIQRRVNFTATVATDLKIAFVGDSLTSQVAQAFDAAAIAPGEGRRATAYQVGNIVHECQTMIRTRGGGVSALWRTTALFSEANRALSARCIHRWRLWSAQQAFTFLDQRIDAPFESASMAATPCTDPRCELPPGDRSRSGRVNGFDAVVFRVPLGWMDLDEVTETGVREALGIARRYLGAGSVILTTQPMSNNVRDMGQWRQVAELNRMIRRVARDLTTNSTNGAEYVLVQEFGNLTNQMMFHNARHLGFNLTEPDFAEEGWELEVPAFLERLQHRNIKWRPSYAQCCASLSLLEDGNCPRNRISPDGTHWCIESIGARYVASIACLLGCIFNGYPRPSHTEVRKCEARCNDEFMSLGRVFGSGLQGSDELYSQSTQR